MTQKEVAQMFGVARETVASYETGRREIPKKSLSIIEDLETQASPVTNVRLPVFYDPQPIRYAGEVPAGNWGDPLESEEFVDSDPALFHSQRYVTGVNGLSMYPILCPGDTLYWHYDRNPKLGVIVLAEQTAERECTVKVLDFDDDNRRPSLKAINPDYSEIDEGNGWEVVARLVAVLRVIEGLERRWYLPEGLRPKHLT